MAYSLGVPLRPGWHGSPISGARADRFSAPCPSPRPERAVRARPSDRPKPVAGDDAECCFALTLGQGVAAWLAFSGEGAVARKMAGLGPPCPPPPPPPPRPPARVSHTPPPAAP